MQAKAKHSRCLGQRCGSSPPEPKQAAAIPWWNRSRALGGPTRAAKVWGDHKKEDPSAVRQRFGGMWMTLGDDAMIWLSLGSLSAAASCSKWSAFSKYSATIFTDVTTGQRVDTTTPKPAMYDRQNALGQKTARRGSRRTSTRAESRSAKCRAERATSAG